MVTQNAKIRSVEYNNAYNSVSNVLGVGSGQFGYGQTLNSVTASVTTATKISRTHWANLRLDILKIAGHQGLSENAAWTSGTLTSIPVLPTFTTGGKITSADITKIENAIAVVSNTSNVYSLGADQYSDELLTQSQRTTQWNATISHYFTLDFGSANNARYFFNAGGQIRINPNFLKSSSTVINNDWEFLVNNVGTVVFGYTNTSVSGSQVSSIGFYDLTNTATQIYTRTGGSQNTTYSVNDYTIRAFSNVATNTSGGARYVYFEIEFKDDKGPNPNFDEMVTGTVTNTVRMFRPSGTNVAITAPTVTVTQTL